METGVTPFARAYLAFGACPGDMTFDEVLAQHLHHGVVISTPRMFAMMRPVPWPVPEVAWRHPQIEWKEKDWGCWYVHLFAGDLRLLLAMDMMTPRLGWCAWHSRHHGRTRLHCACVERMRKHK